MNTAVYSETLCWVLFVGSVVSCAAVSITAFATKFTKAPAYRHHAWVFCLLIIMALPLLIVSAPKLDVPVLENEVLSSVAISHPRIEKAPVRAIRSKKVSVKPVNDVKTRRRVNSSVSDNNPTRKMAMGADGIRLATPFSPTAPTPAPTALSSGWDLRRILAALWTLIASLLVTRAVWGFAKLRRLAKHSTPLGIPNAALAKRLEKVAVLVSPSVDAPLCFGLFKPVILIPKSIADTSSNQKMALILTHELAHIERKDFAMLMLQQIIGVVYFFNPFVWYANRRLVIEREKLCDNWVLENGEEIRYAKMLAEFAEKAISLNHQSTALVEGGVLQRVKHILDKKASRALKVPTSFMFLSVFLAISFMFVFGCLRLTAKENSEKPSADIAASSKSKQSEKLLFKVTDTAGAPLPGAKLTLTENWSGISTKKNTDSKGLCVFNLKPKTNNVLVRISADGYAAKRFSWQSRLKNKKKFSDVTVKLDKGTLIGGIVKNKKGEPVAGAVLDISLRFNKRNLGCGKRIYLADTYSVKTDPMGKWSLRTCAADNINLVFSSDFKHEKYYTNDTFDISVANSPRLFAALRNLSYVTVVEKGVEVRGVVKDDSGTPVNGAWVASLFKSSVRTNAKGEFVLPACGRGEGVKLFVFAEGLAPFDGYVSPSEHIAIMLSAGKALTGKITDPEGNPVEDAVLTLHDGNPTVDVHTDSDGMFRIEHFPKNVPLTCDISKKGFFTYRSYDLSLNDNPARITLLPAIEVSALVVDAKTGKPPEKFVVYFYRNDREICGIRMKGGAKGRFKETLEEELFKDEQEKALANGFDITTSIQSRGYKTATIRRHIDFRKQHPIELAFKLEKAEMLTGRVLDAGGSPVSGAKIGAIGSDPSSNLGGYFLNTDSKQRDRYESLMAVSDKNGVYAFPLLPERSVPIVFASPKGVAARKSDTIKNNPDTTLRPWGKLKGKAVFLGRPLAHARVSCRVELLDGSIYYSTQVKTDENGFFEFGKLPPGNFEISYFGPKLSLSRIKGSLPPGEVKTVDFASNKRLIKAKIVSKGVPGVSFEDVATRYRLIARFARAPEKFSDDNLEDFRSSRKTEIRDNGELIGEIDSPGSYTVELSINNSNFSSQQQIASFEVKSVGPDMPPIDLGELKLEVNRILFIDKKARNIKGVVLTPDGTPAKFAQVVLFANSSVTYNYPFADDGSQRAGNMEILEHSTNSNGAYSVPVPLNENAVVGIFHTSGCVIFKSFDEFAKAGKITLERWGSLEGRVRIGGKTVANREICVSSVRNHISMCKILKADKNGVFECQDIIPGFVCVSVNTHSNGGYLFSQYVEIRSGEKAKVELGTEGGEVFGAIAMPDGSKLPKDILEDVFVDVSLELPENLPPAKDLPAGWEKMDEKKRILWFSKLPFSDAGMKILDLGDYTLSFPASFDKKTGIFHATNLPPGKYTLFVSAATYYAEKLFSVSKPASGKKDLGTIRLLVDE